MCVCVCRTPLHAAAFAEDVAGLQLVLRHGAEINAVDNSGRSALMVAADKGHSGTVGKSHLLLLLFTTRTTKGLSLCFFFLLSNNRWLYATLRASMGLLCVSSSDNNCL